MAKINTGYPMPELPEVEIIARNLRNGHPRKPQIDKIPDGEHIVREPRGEDETAPLFADSILGKVITGARLFWPRTLVEPDEQTFYHQITGQRVIDVGRRAKYLIIHLTSHKLIIHLRMSGDILISPVDQPLAPHDRLTLILDDQYRFAFNDTRKFGRVWLMDDPTFLFEKLGPEPFSDEFSPEWLYSALQKKNRQLKPLLLDQSFLAGMGNIYTDEALHRAGIHPLTPSGLVSKSQAEMLWAKIREVLLAGIQHNGSSIDWVYRGGGFQNHFGVYGREGELCPACETPIQRIVVSQRGTHFCPKCQDLSIIPGTFR
jgi:formamidopyrimidine-DNA glycosylase